MFQDFRYSDTERLSRNDKVLKSKNFKKDATLKLSKSSNHVTDPDECKITWAFWKKVLAHKNQGGLGVNSFYALNLALMFKWIWRFLIASSCLWISVIKSIHGNSGGLENLPSYCGPISTWSRIVRATNKLKEKGVDLMKYFKLVIGNGNATRFWHHRWCGDVCFKDRFHRLFNLELQKDVSVAFKLQAPTIDYYY
ncbi:hypothetical protein Tco_0967240 [Tanacetum coccineum]